MGRAKRPALGRGLGALIPDKPASPRTGERNASAPNEPRPASAPTPSAGKSVAIECVEPNPKQPRRRFDEAKLEELARSIEAQGIIQPVIVCPIPNRPGRYQILAGERRWRAAQKAGLHEVPVVVRETPLAERLELALVENIQRADLNPIEEARAYQALIDQHDYTQEALASRVGKDRSTVANGLRLLRLPVKVQELVMDGELSMGHARALLGLPTDAEMVEVGLEVVRRSLSVRSTEREVKRRQHLAEPQTEHAPSDEEERHAIIVGDLERRLERHLGVRVKLKTGGRAKGPGRIEIPYQDLDQLNELLHRLMGTPHP